MGSSRRPMTKCSARGPRERHTPGTRTPLQGHDPGPTSNPITRATPPRRDPVQPRMAHQREHDDRQGGGTGAAHRASVISGELACKAEQRKGEGPDWAVICCARVPEAEPPLQGIELIQTAPDGPRQMPRDPSRRTSPVHLDGEQVERFRRRRTGPPRPRAGPVAGLSTQSS